MNIAIEKQNIKEVEHIRQLVLSLQNTQSFLYKNLCDKLKLTSEDEEKLFDYIYNGEDIKLTEKINLP